MESQSGSPCSWAPFFSAEEIGLFAPCLHYDYKYVAKSRHPDSEYNISFLLTPRNLNALKVRFCSDKRM